jgi:hypothetical protein
MLFSLFRLLNSKFKNNLKIIILLFETTTISTVIIVKVTWKEDIPLKK